MLHGCTVCGCNCSTCHVNYTCEIHTYSISRLYCQQKKSLQTLERNSAMKCFRRSRNYKRVLSNILCCTDTNVFENSPQIEFHRALTSTFQILLSQGLNKYAKTTNNKQNDQDVFSPGFASRLKTHSELSLGL